MKKIFTLLSAIIITSNIFAQAPRKMSYQAVIRNASNALVSNAPVKMRISILQGSATGTAVYSELHSATTNANGLVSIEIGSGTSPVGTIGSINWGNGTYFLKTETDPTNGTNYSIEGTSQLLSVPYALQSGNGIKRISTLGDTMFLDNGKSIIIPGISNANNSSGPNTELPLSPENLIGTVESDVKIKLEWTDKSTNEDGFKIVRKSGSENFTEVGIVGKDITNFSDFGLIPSTTYTYRVYAYNSVGASLNFSNEVTLTTNINNAGTATDVSGNTYTTVTIGTQVWMKENLRTTKYNDGTNIILVTQGGEWANNVNNSTTIPMMCWYNNDQTTYANNKFGALYNWFAINPSTNGNKNVCPFGWHVPTDAEWTTLINYLGGEGIAGGKMKSEGTQNWNNPNADATNSSGFSGLPGGLRYGNGNFNFIRDVNFIWSSTEFSTFNAWLRFLNTTNSLAVRGNSEKAAGHSVRCIKD